LPLTGEVDPDFSKKTLKLVKEETMFALFGQESGSTPKYVPLVTSLASATGHDLNRHTTRSMNQHRPVLIRLPHGIWMAGMRRVM
jgi:hypothetical protein